MTIIELGNSFEEVTFNLLNACIVWGKWESSVKCISTKMSLFGVLEQIRWQKSNESANVSFSKTIDRKVLIDCMVVCLSVCPSVCASHHTLHAQRWKSADQTSRAHKLDTPTHVYPTLALYMVDIIPAWRPKFQKRWGRSVKISQSISVKARNM